MSTVFGTVYEHIQAGRRPVQGLALRIAGYRPDDTYFTTTVVTDANGRYVVPSVKRRWAAVDVVVQLDYLSPCSVDISNWSDESLDVHVVSRSELHAHGMPMSMPPFAPGVGYEAVEALSGRVTEGGPEGVRPALGALVEHLWGDAGDARGFMVTDADGRYVVCASAAGWWDYDGRQAIRVSKDGYHTVIKGLDSASTQASFDAHLIPY